MRSINPFDRKSLSGGSEKKEKGRSRETMGDPVSDAMLLSVAVD